jgi:hypothetical protein
LINTPGVTEVYLLKTNKWGDSLWTKHLDYNNGPGAYNDGASVKETNDKGFIITGLRNYAPNWNMHLLKTDSLGNLLWARNYSESTCASQGFSVQLTADNGFVIAGFISDCLNTNDEDFYLVKTDSIGNLLWSKRYGESKRNRAYSVSCTFDKGFIITGIGNWDPSIPSGSIYLVRTDSIGDTVWTKRYGGTAIDEGFSVIQTLDGGFVLTGYTASYGQGSVDVWIIKTNSDGNIEWEKKYGGFRSDIGRSIQQTYDGGFIIAGYTNSFGSESGYDIYLINTNEIGEMAVNENFLPALEIILYPNPARNKVTIINKSIFSEVLIDIFDICGEKRWEDKFLYQKSIELDVSNLPMGFYILNILTEDGSLTKKLVIN